MTLSVGGLFELGVRFKSLSLDPGGRTLMNSVLAALLARPEEEGYEQKTCSTQPFT